jgi:hypothetical protein
VDGWPRTEAVDGAALVAAVNAAIGGGLVAAGRLPGGNAGATLARRGDREVVVTFWAGTPPGHRTAVDLTGRLAAAGYPIPPYELVPGGRAARPCSRSPLTGAPGRADVGLTQCGPSTSAWWAADSGVQPTSPGWR